MREAVGVREYVGSPSATVPMVILSAFQHIQCLATATYSRFPYLIIGKGKAVRN